MKNFYCLVARTFDNLLYESSSKSPPLWPSTYTKSLNTLTNLTSIKRKYINLSKRRSDNFNQLILPIIFRPLLVTLIIHSKRYSYWWSAGWTNFRQESIFSRTEYLIKEIYQFFIYLECFNLIKLKPIKLRRTKILKLSEY